MYGDLIRQYREKLGINQGEFVDQLQAAGLDVTRGAVSHWETGRNPSPLDSARDILILARVLKLDLQDILDVLIDDETTRTLSDAARSAAQLVEDLPPDARQVAVEQLRSLSKLFADK